MGIGYSFFARLINHCPSKFPSISHLFLLQSFLWGPLCCLQDSRIVHSLCESHGRWTHLKLRENNYICKRRRTFLKGTQRLLNTEWRLTFSIGAAGFVQKPRRSFTDSLVGFCTKGVWGGGQKGGKCLYRPRANFDKYTQQNTSSARPPTHTCEAAPDSWPGPEFWGSMGPRRSLTDCFREVAGGCWKTKTVYNCEMEGILADK